jgi:hypothetical protein
VKPHRGQAGSVTKIATEGKDLGIVTAVRAVTGNVDYQGDRIVPGAFGPFISEVKGGERPWPGQAWQHDIDSPPIGKARDMIELAPRDPRLPERIRSQGFGGLLVTSEYNLEMQKGAEVFSAIKKGHLEESSFMFLPGQTTRMRPEQRQTLDHVQDLNTIADIVEFSDVWRGANPLTTTMAYKSPAAQRARRTPTSLELWIAQMAVDAGQIAGAKAAYGSYWRGHVDAAVLDRTRQQYR